MLLITNFKDYYDHMASYGVDKTIPYRRLANTINHWENRYFNLAVKCEEKINPNWMTYNYYESKRHNPAHEARLGVKGIDAVHAGWFGFCGKIYPVNVVTFIPTSTNTDLVIFAGTKLADMFIDSPDIPKKGYRKWRYINAGLQERYNHDGCFAENKVIQDEAPFGTLQTPYFLSCGGNIWKNFPLRNTDFPKVMHAQDVWQQLQFFLTNTLRINDRPMLEVEEKYKIIGAGFDLKTSFRHPV
jgi:hypothetical protein